ncbi:uncharacterized protein LOC131620720 [Vicia villosa]|uniref:uncharacterized protein LOC131620720 n=1 Tax=Vicia villosa TaxID=3911 RepID=UPI00273C6E43|nr:uncharacterized protein LOC131620720 [Vicia villosa]
MASITTTMLSIAPTRRRVFVARATKGAAGGGKEEKGFLDWILGGMQKEDQLLETDPILKKVEGKNGGGTTTSGRGSKNGRGTTSGGRGGKNSVAVPQKKKGVFEGLFSKN